MNAAYGEQSQTPRHRSRGIPSRAVLIYSPNCTYNVTWNGCGIASLDIARCSVQESLANLTAKYQLKISALTTISQISESIFQWSLISISTVLTWVATLSVQHFKAPDKAFEKASCHLQINLKEQCCTQLKILREAVYRPNKLSQNHGKGHFSSSSENFSKVSW